MAQNDGVLTLREFLDEKGNPIPLDNIDELARHLIRLSPVLRLRDARFMRRIRNGTVPNMPEVEVTARELDFLARELVSRRRTSPTARSVRGCLPWCNCWSTTSLSRERGRRATA